MCTSSPSSSALNGFLPLAPSACSISEAPAVMYADARAVATACVDVASLSGLASSG